MISAEVNSKIVPVHELCVANDYRALTEDEIIRLRMKVPYLSRRGSRRSFAVH